MITENSEMLLNFCLYFCTVKQIVHICYWVPQIKLWLTLTVPLIHFCSKVLNIVTLRRSCIKPAKQIRACHMEKVLTIFACCMFVDLRQRYYPGSTVLLLNPFSHSIGIGCNMALCEDVSTSCPLGSATWGYAGVHEFTRSFITRWVTTRATVHTTWDN